MTHRMIAVAASIVFIAFSMARGAGYDANIELTDGKNVQSAKSRSTTAPSVTPSTLDKRVAMEGSVDGHYTVKWKVVRTDQSTTKDELVHIYVVKLDQPGQAPPALDPMRVVLESAVTMDFPPGEESGGTQQFRIDAPGVYLLRVEVGVDPDKPGTEDFAELELVAK